MATPPAGSARCPRGPFRGSTPPAPRTSRLRATYPSLLARIVYQVGSPAMFDGNRFFPLTGTPIPKMLFSSTLLADCEPDPFTVATIDAEIVCHALLRAQCALFLTQGQVSCRHLAGFPSGKFWKESIFHSTVIIVTCKSPRPAQERMVYPFESLDMQTVFIDSRERSALQRTL